MFPTQEGDNWSRKAAQKLVGYYWMNEGGYLAKDFLIDTFSWIDKD